MKRLVCFFALLPFASQRSYTSGSETHDTSGLAETICITNVFAVDIKYPNIFVSVLARLAGVQTDSLKLVEWDIRTPFLSSFLLHLTDDGEHRWFEIASDSAFPSFVKLPLEDRTTSRAECTQFLQTCFGVFPEHRNGYPPCDLRI
jgi:hypothetical protein